MATPEEVPDDELLGDVAALGATGAAAEADPTPETEAARWAAYEKLTDKYKS